MKVLRKTDRVKFLVNSVAFIIAPLSFSDRIEVATSFSQSSGNATDDFLTQSKTLIKKCLKDVIGLTDFNDQPYLLEFTCENKIELTDDCAEEIFKCIESATAVASFIKVTGGNIHEIPEKEFTVLGKS